MKRSTTTGNLTTLKQKNDASAASRRGKDRIGPEYRLLLLVAAALALACLCSMFLFRLARVQGDSMNDTLSHNDWVIAAPLAYHDRQPERGDIILLQRDSLTQGYIVKRIAGLPGETVEIREGRLYINGDPVDDPFFVPDSEDNFGPLLVEPDSWFVLGDNRAVSNDSRYWEEPLVASHEIRGKIIWKLFPVITNL